MSGDSFSLRSLMDELAECGASPRVMAIVGEIVAKCLGRGIIHPDVSAAELRRERDRERKRHSNGNSTDSTEFHGNGILYNNKTPGGGRGVGKGEVSTEFETLWKRYPRKKSKGKAEKAYQAARKLASMEEISAGIDRLIAEKREEQFNPYFATWLNAKGWLDEQAKAVNHAWRSFPRWSDVRYDYEQKYGKEEALKRYTEDAQRASDNG